MKSSGIGGQAVLEGVMMKNKEKYAIAVRKPDNEICVEISEYKSLNQKVKLFKLPILRGMAAFIDSMVIGVRALTYSSSFYEEEDEKEKQKNPSKAKDAFFTFITVLMSVVLAVGVFMLLPLFLSQLLNNVITSNFVILLIEGIIKILLFVGYVVLISQMKDIKRFFMYHGAEHKTINCIEGGHELNVENVRRSSKEHKRCGTSFMLYVILLSVIFFMFIQVDTVWLRYVLRILLVPVIAGVSYEFIRLAGNTNNIIIRILSKPGLWMQALTTKEPDDSMIEVAICSVEAVFDWKEYLQTNGVKNKRTQNSKDRGTRKTSRKKSAPSEGSEVKDEIAATRMTINTQEDELANLDKMLYEKIESSPEDKQQQLKEKVQSHRGAIAFNEIAASLEPDEEEDDEVLMALDRYFSYEKDKVKD